MTECKMMKKFAKILQDRTKELLVEAERIEDRRFLVKKLAYSLVAWALEEIANAAMSAAKTKRRKRKKSKKSRKKSKTRRKKK